MANYMLLGSSRHVFIYHSFASNLTAANCSLLLMLTGRMMLMKEKQQREEVEKQRRELEERLRRYEEDFENAKRGL